MAHRIHGVNVVRHFSLSTACISSLLHLGHSFLPGHNFSCTGSLRIRRFLCGYYSQTWLFLCGPCTNPCIRLLQQVYPRPWESNEVCIQWSVDLSRRSRSLLWITGEIWIQIQIRTFRPMIQGAWCRFMNAKPLSLQISFNAAKYINGIRFPSAWTWRSS